MDSKKTDKRRTSAASAIAAAVAASTANADGPASPNMPGIVGQLRTTLRRIGSKWMNVVRDSSSLYHGTIVTMEPVPAKDGTPIPKGLPLREALQALYQIRRDRTIMELTLFLLYLLVFGTVIYDVFDVGTSFQTNDALMDLFLDEEFADANYKKNFFEVMTQEEFWTWTKGPLLGGAYPSEWYNGEPLSSVQEHLLIYTFRQMGGVQLRQMRVRDDSCFTGSLDVPAGATCLEPGANGTCLAYSAGLDTRTQDGKCFAEYELGSTDARDPYGPDGVWTWSDGHHDLTGLYGFGPNYGTGGYVVQLPENRTVAEDMVNFLEENLWTDRGTRAVSAMINVYNPQTRLVTVMRFLFEFFASGHVVKSYRLYTFKLELYVTNSDRWRALGEVGVVVGLMMYLAGELVELSRRGFSAYWSDLTNIYEMVVHILIIMCGLYWAKLLVSPLNDSFNVNNGQFVDLFDYGQKYGYVFTLAGFIVILQTLKIFRFFSISKQMNSLWYTLYIAAPDLLAFLIGFMLLIGGFSFMAVMLYGSLIRDFHTLPAAVSTLLRFTLGDFDYRALAEARPEMTPWFFSAYTAFLVFVATNVLIGIVTMYFEVVSITLKKEDPWKRALPSLNARLQQYLRVWCLLGRRRFCCERNVAVQADELQHSTEAMMVKSWEHERKFIDHLGKCMDLAEELNGLDLFAYCDEIYRSRERQENVYLGLKELRKIICRDRLVTKKNRVCRRGCCYSVGRLSRRLQCCECCRPATRTEVDEATELLHLYTAWKKVTLVGDVVRHSVNSQYGRVLPKDAKAAEGAEEDEPEEDEGEEEEQDIVAAEEAGIDWREYYVVEKMNRRGVRDIRQLAIDDRNPADPNIMNYDRAGRLRRIMPVSQLVQMEENRFDKRALLLVFVNAEEHAAREGNEEAAPSNDLGVELVNNKGADKGGGDTSYSLIFETTLDRSAFVGRIIRMTRKMKEMRDRLEGNDDAAVDSSGPSSLIARITEQLEQSNKMLRALKQKVAMLQQAPKEQSAAAKHSAAFLAALGKKPAAASSGGGSGGGNQGGSALAKSLSNATSQRGKLGASLFAAARATKAAEAAAAAAQAPVAAPGGSGGAGAAGGAAVELVASRKPRGSAVLGLAGRIGGTSRTPGAAARLMAAARRAKEAENDS